MPTLGTIQTIPFESRALRGNRLRDPHVRPLLVYLPPDYQTSPRRYPVVMLLTGYGGRSTYWINRKKIHRPIHEIMEQALARRGARPAILVMPDGWTRYGGSQYRNSPLSGNYEDYLIDEVLPFVDRRYRTIPKPEARAVMGKSSGGYGALVLAMRNPEVFGNAVCHSGDVYFEVTHKPMLAKFVDACRGRLPSPSRAARSHDLAYVFGLSAAYSPNLRARPYGFDLPVRVPSGEIMEPVWKRWLANDPLEMLRRHADSLRRLRFFFMDCGSRDEFYLHLGARVFVERARKLGIPVRYEEFPAGHFKISYRYERSLPLLLSALPLDR